jgi:hypothetical protein
MMLFNMIMIQNKLKKYWLQSLSQNMQIIWKKIYRKRKLKISSNMLINNLCFKFKKTQIFSKFTIKNIKKANKINKYKKIIYN